MQESWTRLLSVALVGFLAVGAEALPKNREAATSTSNTAKTGTGTGTKAAASPSSSITKATDGSTILDKTVVIKYVPVSHRAYEKLTQTAVSQFATKLAHQPIYSHPPQA